MVKSNDFNSLNYELNDDIMSELKEKYHSITELVNSSYWDIKSNKINGYIIDKGEENFKHGNISMIVVLPKGIYSKYNFGSWNSQIVLLKEFIGKLKRRYKNIEPGKDNCSVNISFDNLIFNIKPVFKNGEDSFFYPNGSDNGSWDKLENSIELFTID